MTPEHREQVQAQVLGRILAQPESPKKDAQLRWFKEQKAKLQQAAPAWETMVREDQREPLEPWHYWLVLAGRGWGKTRVGAEWVKKHALSGDYGYVNLIGATADDARDIMIEGESGILSICSNLEKPRYIASKRQLVWQNGCKSLIFTADEPERLRGKQHQKLWCDEIASWRYAESWTQATLGLRLAPNPQAVLTTTPKPRKFLRKLIAREGVRVTRGTTYQNRQNLDPVFFENIISEYEGTALGEQELNAKLLDQAEGALWQRSWLESSRVETHPDLVKLFVGVDPPGGVTECGIAAAGVDAAGEVFAGWDRSAKLSPDGWARRSVDLCDEIQADGIVAEKNFGGDMVLSTIRTVSARVPVELVTASRGKAIRAQPVSALWEKGKAHLVGSHPDLEDELCGWVPGVTKQSPNRLDALVWAVTAAALIQPKGRGGRRDFLDW